MSHCGVLILLVCDPAGLTRSWQQVISMTPKSRADSSKPSRLPKTREYIALTPNELTLIPSCLDPDCHTIFWSWIRHGKSSLIQTITFSIPWVSPISLCGHTVLGQTHRGAQLNISQLNEGQNSFLVNHIPQHDKQLNPYLACMATLLRATLD